MLKVDIIFRMQKLVYKNHMASIAEETSIHLDSTAEYHILIKAINSYNEKNYRKAIGYSWIILSSAKNYSYAPYIIGCCYYNGIILSKNVDKALIYYIFGFYSNMYESQKNASLIYYNKAKSAIHNDSKKRFYNTSLHFFTIAYNNKNKSILEKVYIYYYIISLRTYMIFYFIEINNKHILKIPSLENILKIIKEDSKELDIFRNEVI
jgi:hypothetical protein